MSEQAPAPEQTVATAPGRSPTVAGFSRTSLMNIVLAVVLAVFLWQWFDAHRQIDNMQQELARRLAEMEGNSKAGQVLVAQVREAERELSAKLGLLEARYAETQSQRAALDALYREMSGSRDEMALAEVEQMLLIAGQQLQLSANVKAALIAMQQADERLKRMDRAALNGLRKVIARDTDKLRSLPGADVPGINLRLDGVIATVDALPLIQEVRSAQETALSAPAASPGLSGWQKLLHEIWGEAKQMIRIENLQKHELPLISPTQSFFLRENLKLRLLSARLALLTHDEAGFRRDLQAAQEWVSRHFDAKSAQVAQTVAALQRLRDSNISIEAPDIGASLEAVRNFRITREKAAR